LARVHARTTSPLVARRFREGPDDGDLPVCRRVEGQQIVLVLEQNKSLGGRLTGEVVVSLLHGVAELDVGTV